MFKKTPFNFMTLNTVEEGSRIPFTGDFAAHSADIYKTFVRVDEDFATFATVINSNSKTMGKMFKFSKQINVKATVALLAAGAGIGIAHAAHTKINALELKIEELERRLNDLDIIEDMDIDLEKEVEDDAE